MNTKRIIYLSSLLTLILSAVSCSSGRSGVERNAICPKNYNPHPLENKNFKSKVDITPDDPFSPDPADYGYNGSDFYIYDKVRDIKIHARHVKSSSGKFVREIVCVSGEGINRHMEPFMFALPLVSDMQVSEDGTIKVRYINWRVSIKKDPKLPWFTSETTQDTNFTTGTPQDSYTDFVNVGQTFAKMRMPNNLYRLISRAEDLFVEVRTSVALKPITPEERDLRSKDESSSGQDSSQE